MTILFWSERLSDDVSEEVKLQLEPGTISNIRALQMTPIGIGDNSQVQRLQGSAGS